ncbi:MAG: VWA domain-containing protein [Deltaproteobacteria bacterium]|jgi:Ca-activated chloride channel family protein|nr:VWA domain-containing protein [Deltaproteobacteria bacterium]
MKRRESKAKSKGPIEKSSEDINLNTYHQKHKRLVFALDTIFPWMIFMIVMAILAWVMHLYFDNLIKPVEFGAPLYIWALLALPLLAWYSFRKTQSRIPSFKYSRLSLLTSIRPGFKTYFKTLPSTLKLGVLALLLFAMAEPHLVNVYEHSDEKGIDIVLALDISLSMKAEDMRPNRIVVAKDVISKFIEKRPNDRLGLVVFGQYAYPYCPLTLDHKAVQRLLRKIQLGKIDSGKATAIGEALGTSLNMIRRSKSKSKVIILLTDGDNNAGEMGPREAARYATTLGIKIHTILIGNPNASSMSLFAPRAPVNPELLEEISSKTGGIAFRATDRQALEKRFQILLNKMKKNKFEKKIKTKHGIQDRLILAAVFLLFLEILISIFWLRRMP